MRGRRAINLRGHVRGLVTVDERAGNDAKGYPVWKVTCACGVRRLVRSCVLMQNPPTTHRSCAQWKGVLA